MKMTRKLQREWLKGEQRLVKGLSVGALALALSFTVMPPVWASTITASDSFYQSTIQRKDNVYNISEQKHKGTLGYNLFKDFTISNGDVANLLLKDDTTKLLNLVSEKISIDGIVNSYQKNKIGGNVYFISPKGIAVGAKGVLNVGSLMLGTNMFNAYLDYSMGKLDGDYTGEADIVIGGQLNALTNIDVRAKNVTIEGTGRINTGASFKQDAYNNNWKQSDYVSKLVNVNGIDSASHVDISKAGKVYLYGKTKVEFAGKSATNGGDFAVKSEETISIKGTDAGNKAVINTQAGGKTVGTSGDIKLNAIREENGTAEVTLKQAELNADRSAFGAAGNVDINAVTATQAYTYAVLKTKAKVNIEDSSVTGDNVRVAAMATNTGNFGADAGGLTDEQKRQNIDKYATENQDSIVNTIKDIGGNARLILAFGDVTADATVDVTNSSLKAVGGTKGDKLEGDKPELAEHGMLDIKTQANTGMQTKNLGLVGIGVNVMVTEADSKITVKNSDLSAAKDMSIKALGNNDINIYYLDLSLADEKLRTAVGFSMADLTNDVGVTIDKQSTLTAGHDIDISSEAYRSLAISASGSGDSTCLGLSVGLGLVDSKAITDVKGKLYVGNDLDVTAKSAIKYDEKTKQYSSDKLVVASASGDSYLKEATTPIKEPVVGGVKSVGGKIMDWIKNELDIESSESDSESTEPPAGSKWGVNAATAVLVADTRAEAHLDGIVRGVTNGLGDNNKAMGGNLNVKADTISRLSLNTSTFQNKLTDGHGNEVNSKDTGISLSVNYGQEHNTALADVGGDLKLAGEANVKAKNSTPWQTSFTDTTMSGLVGSAMGVLTDKNLGVANLVDSWSTATANTEKVGVAGSVGVLNYTNNADAHLAANTKLEAGKALTVSALNDITTVNFSGNIKSPLNSQPISAIWLKDKYKLGNMWGTEGEGSAVGGAALSVHQHNTAKAYLASDAKGTAGKVTAAKLDVNAKNEAMNLAMAASGGKSDSVAINGTVLVNRFDNKTEAYIGKTDVKLVRNAAVKDSGNITVSAIDNSRDISLGGAVGVTEGSTGIGATIAYNHIDRDTDAYILGSITDAKNIVLEAQNSGLIVAVGVAGSVAMDKNEAAEAADSVGDAAAAGRDALDVDENTVNDLLNSGEREQVTADTGASAVEQVNNEAGEADVDEAKNSFAIAGSVAVNRILDKAHAYVGKNPAASALTYAPSITADTLNIKSYNDSLITNVTGAFSLNLQSVDNANAIGGSFTYNSITSENIAAVKDATLTLKGNADSSKDEALNAVAENKEEIVNIAVSGGVATKGNSWVGQVGVNWVDTTTQAYVDGGNVHAGEAVLVKADDAAEINNYIGSVAIAGKESKAAVGVAVGVNLIDEDTQAYAKNTGFSGDAANRKGSLTVQALEESELVSIVAAGAVSTNNSSWALSGSANGDRVLTSAKAYIDADKSLDVGAIKVEAENLSDITLGTGNVSVGGKSLGAAVGVLVADAGAEAYVKGGDSTWEAASMEVAATNTFNGSAKEDSEDTKAKNVAVGGSVAYGDEGYAGQGSVTVNKITQNTKAHVEKGSYRLQGKLDVLANSRTYMFGMAGGLAAGTGGGFGAAVDTQLVDVDTSAYINNGAEVLGAGDIKVQADSVEKITSLALQASAGGEFAGAGAANAHKVDVDTLAWIGSEKDSGADRVYLGFSDQSGVGKVSILASDDAVLKVNAAQGAGAGEVAGGLSIGVAVVDKNVKAAAEYLRTKNLGLLIDAQNTGSVLTTANGVAGAGAVALTGSASESMITYNTDAHIGKNAFIDAAGGAVSVNAKSRFTHVGEAAGVSGAGEVAGGLSNDTTYIKNDTKAYIGKKAFVNTRYGIAVTADHTTDITSAVVAGGFAKTAAFNGGVGVNKLRENVQAYVDDAATLRVIAAQDTKGKATLVNVSAKNTTKLSSGNGGAAIGATAAGGGAAVTVNSIVKNTQAFMGKNVMVSNNRTKDNKLSITANNNEDIYSFVLQGSGGLYAGLAGAVDVNDLTVTTKAFTDTGAWLMAGSVAVDAVHELALTGTVIGASVGAGAIGAAVDVANINTQTNAFLGDSNTLNLLDGDLSVTATENLGTKDKHIKSTTVAGGVGAGAVEGSISIYNIASSMTDADAELLNKSNGNFNDWVKAQGEQSNADEALSKYDNSVAAVVKQQLAESKTEDVTATAGTKGVAAKIGSNSKINAKNVDVKSKQNVYMDDYTGSGSASLLAGVGISVSKLNSTTTTLSHIGNGTRLAATGAVTVDSDVQHEHKSIVNGTSISIVASGQALDSAWNDKSTATATLGDLRSVSADSLKVQAAIGRVYDGYAYGGSAAILGSISGAGIHANIGGGAIAGLGNQSGSKVNTGSYNIKNNISVTAQEKTQLKGEAVVPAVGIFSGAGSGVYLTSDSDAKAYVGNGEKLEAKNITLKAEATPVAEAAAHGYAAGGGGVGAAIARITQKDDAVVNVGAGAQLLAQEKALVQANTKRPESGRNAYAFATAGAAGAVGVSAASTIIELQQSTAVNVGAGAVVKGKAIELEAAHKDSTDLFNNAAVGGTYAGGGLHTTTRINSRAEVTVGEGANVQAVNDLAITADNDSEKGWLKSSDNSYGTSDANAVSSGVGMVSGNGIDNLQDITHTTTVDIKDKAKLHVEKAALTADELKQGLTLTDKNAMNINAHSRITAKDYNTLGSGTLAGAAWIEDDSNITANTKVNLGKGAVLTAGDVSLARTFFGTSGEISDRDKKDVGGGSIGIGAYNDADLYSATLVHIWGAAGGAGSNTDIRYNSTTDINSAAQLETANGDIRMAAGTDSRGREQQIFARADGYIVNATAIPITIYPVPSVTVNNTANVKIDKSDASSNRPDIGSDRNIILTATAGDVTTVADGNTKDWINGSLSIFGFTACDTGKTTKNLTGNVEVNGALETGIHRKQSLSIGGRDVNGKWESDIVYSAGMGFTYEANSKVASELLTRLEELKTMRANYYNDKAASAALEKEITAVEEKLISSGFGCREKGVFVAYDEGNAALKTGKVIVSDVEARLGNISINADNLYGTGKLAAPDDAEVTITNNSPNNLVVNNIYVNSAMIKTDVAEDGKTTKSIIKYDNGAKINFNGVAISQAGDISKKNKDASKKVSFSTLEAHKLGSNTSSAISISNNFVPRDHLNKGGNPIYAAPEVTIADKAMIYNPYGSVNVSSKHGNIHSNGAIYAESVNVEAKNGDFIQNYGERLANIGGLPEKELNGSNSAGIRANGNIIISARYVNVNAPIVSGMQDVSIKIDSRPRFFYLEGNKEKMTTLAKMERWSESQIAARTVYVKDSQGKTVDFVTYDVKKKQLVVDDIEFHGGKVTITGTIMNTNKYGKGSITALDGYGNVKIENNSSLSLSLGNISTGDGTEGVIKLIDLDATTGKISRTTTYTRSNGIVNCKVEYANGRTTSSNTAEYKPDELYYNWLTGKDSSYVTEYLYKGSNFDIFGSWGPIDKKHLDDSKVTNTTTLREYALPEASYVSKNLGSGMKSNGNGVYSSTKTYTTSTSDAYDVTTKSYRKWYELGTVKHYETRYKVKTGTTTITSNAIKADNAIKIGFVGQEEGSVVNAASVNSSININGVINNAQGSTLLNSGKGSIAQGANGFINTKTLNLAAAKDIGSAEQSVLFNAKTLKAAGGGSAYLQSNGMAALQISNLKASDKLSLQAQGNILAGSGTNASASTIELSSAYGKIGSVAAHLRLAVGEGGLRADAYGDIYIDNKTDNLHLDHAVSTQGNVYLSTSGKIIDVNKTDRIDQSTAEKLKSLARAQLLAGKETTIEKQKSMLCAAVDNKFNRYQALKANVQDGRFTLSESEQKVLADAGVDTEKYIAKAQAEYDALQSAGVASWTSADVQAYKESINSSRDSIYANAALQKEQLAADKFLTQQEKADVLVGSCYTAEQLLVNYSPGMLKETTNTNYLLKDVPNVKGHNVTLNTGYGIGSETQLKGLDLNKALQLWTEEELLILGAAEAGDITIGEDGKATIKVVKPIYVEASGRFSGIGGAGAAYLASAGDFAAGAITTKQDARIKAAGSLSNLDVYARSTILEAADGAISDVRVWGDSLTARARKDIDIVADMPAVNSVYSAEGSVKLKGMQNLRVEKVKAGADVNIFAHGSNLDVRSVEAQGMVNIAGDVLKDNGTSSINVGSVKTNGKVTLFAHDNITAKSVSTKGRILVETKDGYMDLGNFSGQSLYIAPYELDRYHVDSFNGVRNYKYIYHLGADEGNDKGGFGEPSGAGYEWYPQFRASVYQSDDLLTYSLPEAQENLAAAPVGVLDSTRLAEVLTNAGEPATEDEIIIL